MLQSLRTLLDSLKILKSTRWGPSIQLQHHLFFLTLILIYFGFPRRLISLHLKSPLSHFGHQRKFVFYCCVFVIQILPLKEYSNLPTLRDDYLGLIQNLLNCFQFHCRCCSLNLNHCTPRRSHCWSKPSQILYRVNLTGFLWSYLWVIFLPAFVVRCLINQIRYFCRLTQT